jgi:hypothetical protein
MNSKAKITKNMAEQPKVMANSHIFGCGLPNRAELGEK